MSEYQLLTKQVIGPRNLPVDGRFLVQNFEDIAEIENPFEGLTVYVKNDGKAYLIKKIRKGSGLEPDSIDINDSDSLAEIVNASNITDLLNAEDFKGPQGEPGTPGAPGTSTYFHIAYADDENGNGFNQDGGAFVATYVDSNPVDDQEKFTNWMPFRGAQGGTGLPGKNGEDGKTQYLHIAYATSENGDDFNVSYFEEATYIGTYVDFTVNDSKNWTDYEWKKYVGPQGPQGPKGEGAQVSIKGRFDDATKMATEWEVYLKGNYVYGQTNKFHSEVVSGDGYIVEDTGHLYVYFTNDEDFNNAWTDAGPIKGDSSYLYIAFSNNSDGTNFWLQSADPTPGRYIAIKATDYKLDTSSLKNTDFQWVLWNGEDGWGYEQVFLLSKEGASVSAPKSSNPVANDLPAHNGNTSNVKGTDDGKWADHPLSVSEEWPLCWVITRTAGKTYSAWKGPSLYSRYAKDGSNGEDGDDGTSPIYLELSNDQAVIPVESDGTIDPDFKDDVTTTMTLYEGSNPITAGVTYSIENSDYGTISKSTITFNKNSFKDWYTVKCTATYNKKDYSKNFHLVKTPNAYEIDTNTSILVKGENKWINVDKLIASVKKWNGTKWIASDKKIFIDYYKADGSKEDTVTYTSEVSFKDCISIELFVTDNNTSTGNKISKEIIGVISDGKDGIDGSAGYTYKTSYVFTRSVNTPNKPSGGNYSNPKPDEDIWEDSVPNGQNPVWMSFRTFAFNDIYFTDDWSTPVQLSNQTGFQVIYTDDDKVTGGTYTPSKLQNNQTITDWITKETEVKWSTNLPNATYMATSIFTGKEWTAWSIVKIKGEKGAPGDRGADGTSVTIKGSVANKEDLVDKYKQTLVLGDSYLDSEGYLWVYQGSEEPVTDDQSKIFKDETNNVYWLNVGKIQGPAGVSSYLYVKHSNDDGATKNFLASGITGKYIGFYYSDESMTDSELEGVKDKFVWTKWSGQDGFGWEQIYCLSNTNYDNGPLLAEIEKTFVGVVPDGWSDIPLQPDKNNPYCWEARRKVTGDEAGEWIGGSNGRARLFDRYITNGVDGLSIEWKGELETAPSNPKQNWCYKNTKDGIVYIYDGADWKPMTHDGSDGIDGTHGTDGNSVFITYHDNAPENEPNKPTGDGTTNGWHTDATKTANWMSQKVAKSADEGEWGNPIRICGLDGQDGSDAYYIELSRDHIVLPLENGAIDTAAENVEIEIHMFYGSTPMSGSNNVIYSCDAVQGISCDAETGVVTINPVQLQSQPKSVKCYAQHNNIKLSKTLEIEYKEHAYKMDVSKTILERNVADGTLVDGNVTITVKKWDVIENKWVIPTKDLYIAVDCTHLTSTGAHFITSKLVDGQCTLNLNEYHYLRSLRLYLTSVNTSLEAAIANSLTWEDIGVVANGEDGDMVEYIYYLNNVETAPKNPTPKNSTLYQNNDWLPSKESNNYTLEDGTPLSSIIAAKWTDNPKGIDETNRYEYVAIRKKSKNVWGPFSDPVIWSSYGVKGDKGDDGEITEEEKNQITNAATQAALNNIENAYYNKEEIDALKQELDEAISTGENNAIAQANSALQRAEEVNTALDSLRNLLLDGERLSKSVLNEQDIYDLSVAALGEEAEKYVKDGAIATNSVWAQHVISLVGKFGYIKAENIEGTEISGFTVQSAKEENGEIIIGEGWKLESDGSGHLANGNISWTDEGVVTFGEDVKLSWNSNIKDIPELVDVTSYTETANKVGAFEQSVSDINDTLATLQSNVSQQTNDIASAQASIEEAETSLTASINKLNTDLSKAITEGDSALTTKLTAQAETLQSQAETLSTLNTTLNNVGQEGSILSPSTIAKLAATTNVGTEITKDEVSSGSILGLVGKFGLVEAEQLSGTTITGKTVKSTSGSWELNNDGSGHLANNNISWDENGVVTFNENVKLNWSSISEAVNDNFEIPEGLDENDVTDIIKKTEISGDKIATGSITTNQLASGAVTADKIEAGTITADKIATGVLTAETVIGDELVGKTIKSSDDSWEINKNGDGHLAKRNISWDENGDLTVKGNIETTAGSKIGSWYTWEDGTISTAKESDTTNPMIKFDSDGSGHLCYENISWDENGNLYLGSLTGADGEVPTVTIGDGAWITTADGSVKAANNNAMFRSNGSGYLGGFDTATQKYKGLSWDTSGNVTINSQLKYNFQVIDLAEVSGETKPPQLKVSDVNKYLVKDSSPSTYLVDPNSSKKLVYINWWSSEITPGSIIDVEIINGSNDSLIVQGLSQSLQTNADILVPIRTSHEYVLPQNNFTLVTLDPAQTAGYTSQLYLLPGTNLQLQLYKESDNSKVCGYIKNIGSFQLTSIDSGTSINTTNVLCSIAPEHNNIPVNNIKIYDKSGISQNSRYVLKYMFEESFSTAGFRTACGNQKFGIRCIKPTFIYDDGFSVLNSGYRNVTFFDENYDNFGLKRLNSNYVFTRSQLSGTSHTSINSILNGLFSLNIEDIEAFKNKNISYSVTLVWYIPEYDKTYISNQIQLNAFDLTVNERFTFAENDLIDLYATLLNSTHKSLDIYAFLSFDTIS